jgi:tripartite-type tricarboxylate transporter receptor subunit TctC
MHERIAALLVAVSCGVAHAQSYPQKPIKVILPFAAAGPADTMARLMAAPMSAHLGQPLVLENRAGAGGILGIDLAAKAAADGYTLAFAAPGPLTIVPHLSSVPYAVDADLAFVSTAGVMPNILAVNAKLGVSSLRELIEAARQKPGSLNFASSGIGTNGHLAGELLKQLAGIDIVHVPYKGGAPAVTDLVAGTVQIIFVNASGILQQVRSGQATALAITSPKRSRLLPGIPSMVEAGMPSLVTEATYGFVAPAKIPPAVLSRLNAAVVAAAKQRDVVDKLSELLADAASSTPQEYRDWTRAESARWAEVIKKGQITAQ